MATQSNPATTTIDALDFDANRTVRSQASGHRSLLDDDVSLMTELAEGMIERDRMRMRREVIRVFSFICAVLSCLCAGSITSFSLYAPQFLTTLHYTQLRVNAVSITAELAMYLPVPLFGYLCDRYSPPPLSFLASILFGLGYILAAFTYKSGPPPDAGHIGGNGWPFGVMILAFVGVGSGTSCMYLSAVATCAKNFAQAKHRGLMLAVPIAAFGLSGMWQSQIGARVLYERLPDGGRGDVNVFRYFIFLGCTLSAVGVLGIFGLKIVDEDEMIDRGVEELERSGLLQESEFFRPQPVRRHSFRSYGSMRDEETDSDEDSDPEHELTLSESMILKKQEEEARHRQKKYWLLNHATHTFLTDRSMWLLASGFFLLTGPGEAYINNLGTIIPALTPPHWFSPDPPAGSASTHVSIIALTSTCARLLTGTISDLFAPVSSHGSDEQSGSVTFSRLSLLLPSAVVQLIAFLILAIPPLTPTHPPLFLASSAFLGLGYGASFSLVPIIISVVWGVENFATNWGVVAMMPAGGAAVWGIVYSLGYSGAATGEGTDECRGIACFQTWAWGCSVSVTLAIGLWLLAWRSWNRRGVTV